MKTAPGQYPLIVTAAQLSTSSEFQFDGEAVCIPMVSSTGHGHASLKRVHYASGKFAVANIIAAVQLKDASSNSTKFLALYLQHYKDELIVTRMRGTANVSLSIAGLKTIPVNLPPLEGQQRIVDLIRSLDEAIEAADGAIQASKDSSRAMIDELASGTARVDGYSDEWESTKLGSLLSEAEIFTDGDWVESKDQDPTGSVRLVQLADIGDGNFIDKSSRFMTADKAAKLRCTYLKPGDVLMARMPAPLGRATIFPDVGQPAVTVVDVCIIRTGSASIDQEWLCHAINSNGLRSQILAMASGTTRTRISRGNFSTVTLRVPPVEEQRAIVEAVRPLSAIAVSVSAYATSLRILRSDLLAVLFSGEHEIPESYDAFLTSASQLEPVA